MAASKEKAEVSLLLADLLLKSDQPFAIGYPDGRLKMFNPAFAKLTGYTIKELKSMNWIDDLTPEEWHPVEQVNLKKLKKTGKPIRYEKEYRRKDGKQIPVEFLVHQVKDEKGLPALFYSFVTDLSKRKEMEHRLMESEERFRRIFEEGPIGIALLGSDFRFIRANGSFCSLVGYRESELKKMTFKQITHPDHYGQDFDSVKKLLYGVISVYRTQKRYIRKDKKTVWASVTINAIREPNGHFLYFMAMVEELHEKQAL